MMLTNNSGVDISIKAGNLKRLGVAINLNIDEASILVDGNMVICIERLEESNIVTCGKDTIRIMKTENGDERRINNIPYVANGQDRIVVYDKLLEEVLDNVTLDWENETIVR